LSVWSRSSLPMAPPLAGASTTGEG
jgi:hypothetical protein